MLMTTLPHLLFSDFHFHFLQLNLSGTVNPFKKRLISNLYNIILDLRCTSTGKVKAAWEEDLGFSLSEGTWSDILKLLNSSSLCARHCLIQFKVVHRPHTSRVKLSLIYSEVSPYCLRRKSAEASLIHTFWLCPCLNRYWTEVVHTLSRVLQVKLEPQPLVALFGVKEEKSVIF